MVQHATIDQFAEDEPIVIEDLRQHIRLFGRVAAVEITKTVQDIADATNHIPQSLLFEVDFTAGFGDAPSAVPQPLRQAILLLTAHWYEQRSPIEVGQSSAELPAMVTELTRPYRQVRL